MRDLTSTSASGAAGTEAAPEHNGAAWRKSSYSLSEGACVEIARTAGNQVFFRDSKVADGPVLNVHARTAAAFAAALLQGTI
ncbi:DUF397 domain-containing protein [Streptomyces sp. NPDC058961]|uniref:DUF397 domain-containing protein n=1 Tax=unclassified Streptomyces TaxID=2593676 RepID=UPI0035E36B42